MRSFLLHHLHHCFILLFLCFLSFSGTVLARYDRDELCLGLGGKFIFPDPFGNLLSSKQCDLTSAWLEERRTLPDGTEADCYRSASAGRTLLAPDPELHFHSAVFAYNVSCDDHPNAWWTITRQGNCLQNVATKQYLTSCGGISSSCTDSVAKAIIPRVTDERPTSGQHCLMAEDTGRFLLLDGAFNVTSIPQCNYNSMWIWENVSSSSSLLTSSRISGTSAPSEMQNQFALVWYLNRQQGIVLTTGRNLSSSSYAPQPRLQGEYWDPHVEDLWHWTPMGCIANRDESLFFQSLPSDPSTGFGLTNQSLQCTRFVAMPYIHSNQWLSAYFPLGTYCIQDSYQFLAIDSSSAASSTVPALGTSRQCRTSTNTVLQLSGYYLYERVTFLVKNLTIHTDSVPYLHDKHYQLVLRYCVQMYSSERSTYVFLVPDPSRSTGLSTVTGSRAGSHTCVWQVGCKGRRLTTLNHTECLGYDWSQGAFVLSASMCSREVSTTSLNFVPATSYDPGNTPAPIPDTSRLSKCIALTPSSTQPTVFLKSSTNGYLSVSTTCEDGADSNTMWRPVTQGLLTCYVDARSGRFLSPSGTYRVQTVAATTCTSNLAWRLNGACLQSQSVGASLYLQSSSYSYPTLSSSRCSTVTLEDPPDATGTPVPYRPGAPVDDDAASRERKIIIVAVSASLALLFVLVVAFKLCKKKKRQRDGETRLEEQLTMAFQQGEYMAQERERDRHRGHQIAEEMHAYERGDLPFAVVGVPVASGNGSEIVVPPRGGQRQDGDQDKDEDNQGGVATAEEENPPPTAARPEGGDDTAPTDDREGDDILFLRARAMSQTRDRREDGGGPHQPTHPHHPTAQDLHETPHEGDDDDVDDIDTEDDI